MRGKRILITGATSGIGKVTAQALLEQGAELILIVRNVVKAEALKINWTESIPGATVDIIEGDLSSLLSLRNVMDIIRNTYSRIDIIINNAGAIYMSREVSADGYEMSLAMNHLGHYYLTMNLLDLVKKHDDAKIINVSSEGHRLGRPKFDDLQIERSKYFGMTAYGNAKLYNVWFTYALSERVKGDGISVNALHPGVVRTGFAKNNNWFYKALITLSAPFLLSPKKGAETTLFIASNPNDVTGTGKYFKKKSPVQSSPDSYDREKQETLMEISQEFVKKSIQ